MTKHHESFDKENATLFPKYINWKLGLKNMQHYQTDLIEKPRLPILMICNLIKFFMLCSLDCASDLIREASS